MWVQYSGGHFVKYWGAGLVGMPHGKFLKFGPRKWHLKHSENTFCKKLRFQNTV